MSHKFVYVTGAHGQLIRACENCICTAAFNNNNETWEVVKEEGGKFIRGTDPCNGSPSEAKKAAVESRTTRVKDVCYCAECNGKSRHWQDDTNCYCKTCRGKKTHY